MKRFCLLLIVLLSPHIALEASAQSPHYTKNVRSFLDRYCVECHADKPKGDLIVTSVYALLEGGKSGPAVVPGKPEESLLYLLMVGKNSPPMPPPRSKQPKREEIDQVRDWILAGAVDDTATGKSLPFIKPKANATAPISALAYHPKQNLLVAGGRNEVFLFDESGDLLGKLHGQFGKVTALAFNKSGDYLAVAGGTPGVSGEVRIYFFPPSGIPAGKPEFVLAAHKDLIHDLAFSPDGITLATCSYDRLVKLWDVTSGKELRTLKDHSDAVYGLAFSPDGKMLASGAADRTVKVWDAATGKRLYTLAEPIDWVYAVAWSPDSRHLAAAGVDKSIRVWGVSSEGGTVAQSVFAHEAPVTRLVYAADGKTLYSLGEDRTVKAWDAAKMTEGKVYAKQPEAVLALSVRPDQKQLALGRYDGVAVVLEEATGKVLSEPLPIKPKAPQLTKLSPSAAQRGKTILVTFEGKYLDANVELASSLPGVTAKFSIDGQTPTRISADVALPATAPAGDIQLSLKNAAGSSASMPFTVDLFPIIAEKEGNDTPSAAQPIKLPATIVGDMKEAGDVDFFRFEATRGMQIGIQAVTSGVGSKLDPVLQITDLKGFVLAESTTGSLGYVCPLEETYVLSIRDREYRGGAGMHYRLQVGDIPVITAIFPLGLQRGTERDIQVIGVHLGGLYLERVKSQADAALGTQIPISVTTSFGKALGRANVVVGEFPEVIRGSTPQRIPVPGTANGVIDHPGGADLWHFAAKKGERLIVETHARRLGSPLDSVIEILDAKGPPVPRATLRCQAKTNVTFRDHDSAGSNIRIDTWSDLGVNDYLYCGNDLMRIRELPTHPDSDCFFFVEGGQRKGFLDTTPTHHYLGEPMYKVSIHPPGTTFPPNGMPVFTLYYRNDDGGPGYGKDSRLFFDPPADGDYQIRVTDARGPLTLPSPPSAGGEGKGIAPSPSAGGEGRVRGGGTNYAYRLTVRPPRPSFNVRFNPTAPAVWKGGAIPITVDADRIDGYEGPIDIRLENLPPGFSAPPTAILAGENNTAFALYAEPTATVNANLAPIKLIANAKITGQDIVREVTGSVPKLQDNGDLVTVTEQSAVTLVPGKETSLTVKIERKNGFKGRVPIEVKGLPHGVRVLDVGLNGILITETETTRTFVLHAEPWVEPVEHPFVVLAKREGKNTEHAARAVVLKVVAAGGK
jgi:WD40 repeat protein